MSEAAGDPLARLRAVYERWGRGDFRTPEIFHPDVVTIWESRMPIERENVGVEALSRTLRELLGEFDDFAFVAHEFQEVPAGILVSGLISGKGALSGAQVSAAFFHVWSFCDGLATRLEGFYDREPALRAAGLDAEGAQ